MIYRLCNNLHYPRLFEFVLLYFLSTEKEAVVQWSQGSRKHEVLWSTGSAGKKVRCDRMGEGVSKGDIAEVSPLSALLPIWLRVSG